MKIIKIITINILLLISVLVILDYISYKIQVKNDYSGWAIHTKFYDAYTFLPIKSFKEKYENSLKKINKEELFRKDEIMNSNEREIVLFGCSFTYGVGLKENETFSHKLAGYTNRSVFNRGIPGCGANHMLYMLEKGLSTDIKNPKLFIYTYIEPHLYRLYTPASYFHNLLIYYKYKNGKLEQKNDLDLWHWHSYTLRTLYEQATYKNFWNTRTEKFEFLIKHLIRTNALIKEKYEESEFIMLVYNGENEIKEIENKLKVEGIKIIYLSELTDKDLSKKPYILDDEHPSEKAWDEIIPRLAKKLSL